MRERLYNQAGITNIPHLLQLRSRHSEVNPTTMPTNSTARALTTVDDRTSWNGSLIGVCLWFNTTASEGSTTVLSNSGLREWEREQHIDINNKGRMVT